MKNPERRVFFREMSAYVVLSLMLGSYMGLQLYDREQNNAFLEAFNAQTEAMNHFLQGWEKYHGLIDYNEAQIQLKADKGILPPFSCEAVFIREHVVQIRDNHVEK